MTPDEHPPHDDELRSPPSPGVARRTAVMAAWTTPVVAAAVAAPGASASPAPLVIGTYLAVTVRRDSRPGIFITQVLLNAPQTSASTIGLERAAEIRITAGHDVAEWGPGIVAEGPRTGRLLVPAGPYSIINTFLVLGRPVSLANPLGQQISILTASPAGSFPVTVAVASGPVFPGPDPSVTGGRGLPSSTAVIEV